MIRHACPGFDHDPPEWFWPLYGKQPVCTAEQFAHRAFVKGAGRTARSGIRVAAPWGALYRHQFGMPEPFFVIQQRNHLGSDSHQSKVRNLRRLHPFGYLRKTLDHASAGMVDFVRVRHDVGGASNGQSPDMVPVRIVSVNGQRNLVAARDIVGFLAVPADADIDGQAIVGIAYGRCLRIASGLTVARVRALPWSMIRKMKSRCDWSMLLLLFARRVFFFGCSLPARNSPAPPLRRHHQSASPMQISLSEAASRSLRSLNRVSLRAQGSGRPRSAAPPPSTNGRQIGPSPDKSDAVMHALSRSPASRTCNIATGGLDADRVSFPPAKT
jgi:hypothetical protein